VAAGDRILRRAIAALQFIDRQMRGKRQGACHSPSLHPDSVSDRDYDTIIEILAAFVRTRAPWPTLDSTDINQPLRKIAEDVQAALTVIGRRPKYFGHGEQRRLDLSSTDLRHADLRNAHLEGAHLEFAGLDDAILVGTFLSRATLWNIRARKAWLVNADLRFASLNYAHLEEAYFFHPSAEQVQEATNQVDKQAFRDYVKRVTADVPDMDAARLQASARADLLAHADFSNAHFTGTNLKSTDLRQVIGLTAEQIAVAVTDDHTLLPDHLVQASSNADSE